MGGRERLRAGNIFWFRDEPLAGGSVEVREDGAADEKREPVYFCRSCGHSITSRKLSLEIDEKHLHTFMNPSGLIFQIACFSEAPGCRIYGSYTDEFTWFAGYEWSVSLCQVCSQHLGWHYSSGGNGFFGLIMENLSEGEGG